MMRLQNEDLVVIKRSGHFNLTSGIGTDCTLTMTDKLSFSHPLVTLIRCFSILLSWATLFTPAFDATAQAMRPSTPDSYFNVIQRVLKLPEDQIDLAKAKLTIDYMIDPSIDVAGTTAKLDAMTAELRKRVRPQATSMEKVEVLRAYVYQTGPLNDNRPFEYDLDDPFGHNIRNKLLTTYLTTRKGNCISMPFLFIILVQRLGIDLTASTAPQHVFVKYRDELGNLFNLEATSGAGFTRDVWIRQQHPAMTERAVANGIYMQRLSKKETFVVMVGTLLEYFGQTGQEERRIGFAMLLLEHYPKDVSAMLHVINGYSRLVKRDFSSKYPPTGYSRRAKAALC